MIKRFIDWIIAKIIIDKTERRDFTINEYQVFWCSLGENIGDEENGKGDYFRRPVLVFKKFNNNIFWGTPLSTKIKDNKYYVKILLKDEEVSAMISQLRVLNTKRLDEYVGYVSRVDFIKIQNRIIDIIRR
ncbi:type II toxin-antitoxin system PemK/MazF family toxin [Arenimonas sp.]|nr:type II toxin-antitoxin system PemK/MazF family toxin [Candidatus Parcubacteria bacterium]